MFLERETALIDYHLVLDIMRTARRGKDTELRAECKNVKIKFRKKKTKKIPRFYLFFFFFKLGTLSCPIFTTPFCDPSFNSIKSNLHPPELRERLSTLSPPSQEGYYKIAFSSQKSLQRVPCFQQWRSQLFLFYLEWATKIRKKVQKQRWSDGRIPFTH